MNLKVLQQLHPFPAKTQMLATGGILGLCIFLFLQVFQPFGLSELPGSWHKTLILAGYGVVTFGVVAINGAALPVIFKNTYNAARWTLLKDLLYFGVLNFLSVSVVNVFYSSWAFGYDVSAGRLLFAIFSTFTVGLLPFALLLLYRHNRLLRQNLQVAGEMNDQLLPPVVSPPDTTVEIPTMEQEATSTANITIRSDNGYEQLSFTPSDFLYAESADNYVKFCVQANGRPSTKMLRLTMKQAEEQLQNHSGVVRCHRSYLVNVQHVRHVEGNAQGLRLTMHNSDAEIPVARSAVSSIRALLNTP
jgi:hypothetical protein